LVGASKTFEHNGLDEVEDQRLQVEATLAWRCTCNRAASSNIAREATTDTLEMFYKLRMIGSFTYVCLLNVVTLGFCALLKLLG
jgi:hypothetical protein